MNDRGLCDKCAYAKKCDVLVMGKMERCPDFTPLSSLLEEWHESGADKNKSFSVWLKEDAFHCLDCGTALTILEYIAYDGICLTCLHERIVKTKEVSEK